MAKLKWTLEIDEDEAGLIFVALIRQGVKDARLAEIKMDSPKENNLESLSHLHRLGYLTTKICNELAQTRIAQELSSPELREELDFFNKTAEKLCNRVRELKEQEEAEKKEQK